MTDARGPIQALDESRLQRLMKFARQVLSVGRTLDLAMTRPRPSALHNSPAPAAGADSILIP